ncbi:MAG: YkgJ family cysteine cluster protein [Candidatus Methanoperedens sp.]|nr:YkgJ family cysteine cluster protein [Candidatus Methanoperedens sp.]
MDCHTNCDIRLCGSLCCRNCAVLTEEEVSELISKAKEEYALELDPKRYFREAQGEHGIYYAVKMIKGQCIFLNREKRCRVYKCRPLLCELYPVIDVNAVDERCPGIRNSRFPEELLATLKKRYANEIDERIKLEQEFRFI